MNTKVEALEDNQIKISFEIEAADVDARIKRTYKEFAKKYKFPGFRPGKAPRPVIDNMMGADAVRATVTEALVEEAYPKALDENNLCPLFSANYDYETDMVVEGQAFKFTATIQVKPSYELTSYEPVEVTLPSTDATDAEIDAQVDELRNYYNDFKDAPANTKVKKKEIVEFTMTVTDEKGKEVSGLSAENRMYELGINLFSEAFDAELIGMKKGDHKEFDLDMTNDTSMMARTLGDEKGVFHFDVTLNAIKRKILPELTDEWVKMTFGFEDIANMRETIAASIKEQKEEASPRRKENECLYAVGQRVEGELPEGMCELEEANLLQSFYNQLTNAGMTFDSYLTTMGLSAEQFKEDMKKQAQDLVRQDLALDAWARHFGIEATDEEISAEFVKANVDDPVAVEAEWRAAGRIPMIREGVIRTKAMLEVVAGAVVTEAAPVEEEKEEEKKPAKKTAKKATKKAEKAEEPAAEDGE